MRIAHRALLLLAAGLVTLAPSAALSRPARKHAQTATVQRAAPPRASRSLGSPNEGHLEGGERLKTAPYLQVLPGHNNRWGLPHLVGILDRGARRVAQRFPGSVMRVGDLSRKGGGDVSGHHSHESGRDADVAFYVMSPDGKPQNPSGLLSFDEQGKGPGTARFDVARNWTLIESWLKDPKTRVGQIFVASHLRDHLLAYGKQIGAPLGLRNRAALAMMQPTHGLAHDDHFHLRIACPSNQKGTCVEHATREHRAAGARKKSAKARPMLARARKRSGTTGPAAPPLVAAVPAPHDFDDARADADEVDVDEGGEPRVTR
jgi:penicillin-insensitive murein DD-endopeptidase